MDRISLLPDALLAAILARVELVSSRRAMATSRIIRNIVTDRVAFRRARVDVDALEPCFVTVGGTRTMFSDAVEILEPGGVGWRHDASIPGGSRAEHAAVVHHDSLWVIGGVRPTIGMHKKDALRTVAVFEFTSGAWRVGPPLLEARLAHAAGVVDGRLVVCGGAGGDGHEVLLRTCEVLALVDGTAWAVAAEMPHGVWHAACATVAERRLVVAGGDSAAAGITAGSTSIQVYEDEAWRVLDRLRLQQPRYGAAAVPLSSGRIIVFGGSGSLPTDDDDVFQEEEHPLYDNDVDTVLRVLEGQMIVTVLGMGWGGDHVSHRQWLFEGAGRELHAAAPIEEFVSNPVGYTAAVGDGRGRALVVCEGHRDWWEFDESRQNGQCVIPLAAGAPASHPFSPEGFEAEDWSMDGTRPVLACVWM